LDDVVHHCHARKDAARTNDLLASLLRVAVDDPLAARVVLHTVLPALVAITHRVHYGPGTAFVDGEHLDQEVVGIAWEQIISFAGNPPRWPATAIADATAIRLRTLVRQHDRRVTPLVELDDDAATGLGERPACEQLVLELVNAVQHGTI